MDSQLKKEFVKRINNIDRSKHIYRIFDDFLELAYCALAKPAYMQWGDQERADKLEAQWEKVVDRYPSHQFVQEEFGSLLGIVVEGVSNGGEFLGEVAGELGALNESAGQYFTPYNVSKMMAQMLYTPDEIKRLIDKKRYILLGEPACGAGGMVIAFAEMMREQGFYLPMRLLVQAVDISPTAYYMTYIQLTLLNIPAMVVLGNSLTLEVRTSALTLATYEFYCWRGHLFNEPVDEITIDVPPTPQPDFIIRTHQLSLFDFGD